MLGTRPWRYSIPYVIGLSVGGLIVIAQGSGLSTFAAAFPLLIAGNAVSELWWSLATKADVAVPGERRTSAGHATDV